MKVRLDSTKLRAKLLTLPQFMVTALPEAGAIVEKEILEATAQQMRPDRTSFYPVLTPAYAKRKESLVGNRDANLRLTGEMLGSLQYFKEGEYKGEVNVSAEEEQLASYVSVRRPFLIYSSLSLLNIKAKLSEQLKKYFK